MYFHAIAVNFMLHNEMSANQLTDELRKQLKWKLSNITPAIVKRCARWICPTNEDNWIENHPKYLSSVEMNLWFCFQQLRFSTDEKNLLRLGVCMKMSLEYCCCSVHCCIWKLLDKNHPPLTCILSATWGKHMKPPAFKEIKETQKINHFPGKYHSSRSPTKRSSMVKI